MKKGRAKGTPSPPSPPPGSGVSSSSASSSTSSGSTSLSSFLSSGASSVSGGVSSSAISPVKRNNNANSAAKRVAWPTVEGAALGAAYAVGSAAQVVAQRTLLLRSASVGPSRPAALLLIKCAALCAVFAALRLVVPLRRPRLSRASLCIVLAALRRVLFVACLAALPYGALAAAGCLAVLALALTERSTEGPQISGERLVLAFVVAVCITLLLALHDPRASMRHAALLAVYVSCVCGFIVVRSGTKDDDVFAAPASAVRIALADEFYASALCLPILAVLVSAQEGIRWAYLPLVAAAAEFSIGEAALLGGIVVLEAARTVAGARLQQAVSLRTFVAVELAHSVLAWLWFGAEHFSWSAAIILLFANVSAVAFV